MHLFFVDDIETVAETMKRMQTHTYWKMQGIQIVIKALKKRKLKKGSHDMLEKGSFKYFDQLIIRLTKK